MKQVQPLAITFLITAAMATGGVVMAVKASREKPPIVTIARAEPKAEAEFDMRWNDVIVLKKQDRLPLLARSIEPNSVERIDAHDAPARVPPIVMSQQEDKPVTKHRRHVTRDICARHGKRKIAIRGGRSWRCRQ